MQWAVVYKSAENADGTLLFPERLTREFLDEQRRSMGSFLYANQYLNKVVPDDERVFKEEWWQERGQSLDLNDKRIARFGFIDPAIGQEKHHDYTGIVIVATDAQGHWHVELARRYRLNPTQIVDKMFDLCMHFNLVCLGVEIVAYQEALLYILDERMNQRKQTIPVKGIKRTRISKETRIRGLVPRFEWNRITIAPGQADLKDEYSLFPRSSHDDLLDALASIEDIAFYPDDKKEDDLNDNISTGHPDYERYYIRKLARRAAGRERDPE